MPYGIATPSAMERKSWSLTASRLLSPDASWVLEASDQLFLLGVDTQYGDLPRRLKRSRSCVMLANWASRVGGEPFEIFFLLVRSEKFICLSSFATVLRLTANAQGREFGSYFFRGLASPSQTADGIASDLVLHKFFDRRDDFWRFFSTALRPAPAFRTRSTFTSCSSSSRRPRATVPTSSPRISAIWRSPP